MKLPGPTALAAAALLVAPSPADTLLTVDGRVFDGPTMVRTDDAIVVHFENGEVTVPLTMVKDVFIDADTTGLSTRERRKIEKQLAQRREQLAEASAHSEWRDRYIVETKNFSWQYTIPDHIGQEMQRRFETYFEYFKKKWRLKRDKRKPRMPVNFYRTTKQYQRVAGAPAGALAYFRFVEPYDLNSFYDRLDPRGTEMVLYHELSHYVQKLIDEDFKYPHWPGEGVAEYYGGSLYDVEKNKLEIGLLQEGRLAEVKNDISLDKYLGIREIVTKDAYSDYTWGWALVYFFQQDKKLAKGFDRYFLGLAREKGVKRVEFAFGLRTVTPEESLRYLLECLGIKPEDLPDLDQRFHSFVINDLQFESNTALEAAALSAKRSGKSIRAARLFGEAEEAGGLSANGYYQYAQMRRWKDKSAAKKLYAKAIELDPLMGTYYYELGRLIEDGDEQESKRLKALGKELDPEVDGYLIDVQFTQQVDEPDDDDD
jgi:tetratricopeptide (TPR) repeat protein